MSKINDVNYRIEIANEAVDITRNGYYINLKNQRIEISEEMGLSKEKSILYSPKENFPIVNRGCVPKYEITKETTMEAMERLIEVENLKNVVALNFASAKNPGGGFLKGTVAQEECLARSSGLYPTIVQMKEYYEYNKSLKTCLYSDYIIYSSKVPFFRKDNGELLDKPYFASIITSPAVNAGIVTEREPENVPKIKEVMLERIRKILKIAALNGNKTIVLGAFGCGVFRNKPEDVAEYFRQVLKDEDYETMFERIVFAIYDRTSEKFEVFKRVLGN